MALSLAINATPTQKAITQVIEAMFGVQPGHTILNSLSDSADATSLSAVANSLMDFVDSTSKASSEALAAVVVANLGITETSGLSADDVSAAETFVVDALNTAGTADWGSAILDIAVAFSAFTGDATYGAAAAAFNSSVIASLDYSLDSANTDIRDPGGVATEVNLTTGLDNLVGTADSDAFIARIVNNANTAQSGDKIDGGAGEDSLFADIGTSQAFAITLETNSVEKFQVRAQAAAASTGENNLEQVDSDVQIDAERMVGVNHYESNNSRDDLIIEDVRIEDGQITQDITVAFVQSDPGNVDFGVYFDQHSLRNEAPGTSGAGLDLELMDITSAVAGGDPLANNPYDAVQFSLNGETFTLNLDKTKIQSGYANLLIAIQEQLVATPGLEDVTASITGTFTGIDSVTGASATGQTITLINAGDGAFTVGGWIASGVVPADSEFLTLQTPNDGDAFSPLITSTVILDDVGRGSMGGDLIIGGLSLGNLDPNGTSDSKGVEQFNITVERSSELQEISSTNNTLQEVFIKNGDTNGNLVVAGDQNGDNDLPGADIEGGLANNTRNAGFTDVRIIDASTMVGSVDLDAELTDAVVAKYMTLIDDATDATADNIDFIYTLGAANDAFDLTINDFNLAAAGTTTREDFTLVVNGGAGDDAVTVDIAHYNAGVFTLGADTENWFLNSRENANLVINGDAGNDTITTTGAGDFTINAGSGNDTVFTDNAGIQAGLILADTNNDGRVTGGDAATSTSRAVFLVNASNTVLTDLDSNGAALTTAGLPVGEGNALLYKSKLTVTFSGGTTGNTAGVIDGPADIADLGFESTVEIGTTNFIGNQTNVNQAIKEAINGDAVLSKLLLATDGPANTLVITSLVDGSFADTDLNISVTPLSATEFAALSASEIAGLDTAHELLLNDSTAAPVAQADLAAAATAANNVVGLDSNDDGIANAGEAIIATDIAATAIVGAISTFESDNLVNLGTGDDVVVLGTDVNSNDDLVFTGLIGNNTVVNFMNTAADTALDQLDFTSYLTNLISPSTSVESQTRIATTGENIGVGASTLAANEVATVNDFVQNIAGGATETWANLTASNLLAAIQGTNVAGANDYGNIVESSFDVAVTANLVGTTQKGIIMVENDLNQGEYKVFETFSDNVAATEFSSITLLGTVDFGASIDASVVGALV